MAGHAGSIPADYDALLRDSAVAIGQLKQRVAELEGRSQEPVAVVGIGCRLPGGVRSPATYWNLLASGTDAISEVPPERWNADDYYDPNPSAPGKMATRWGGFLDDVDCLDAEFFGISAREARCMDLQQRLLLEVCWEAIENAGIPAEALRGTATGVFVGVSTADYAISAMSKGYEDWDPFFSLGSAHSVLTGRLAHFLDLRGPALCMDTACSSSLVALDLACKRLRSGELSGALVGGVNVMLVPGVTMAFSKGGFMARDGRCKAFDARADGYVRGEGCVVVLLKRLADAVAAGDPIHGVIRGSAVNQDGRSAGITAPNVLAQQAVIRAAWKDAGVSPAEIDLVETHGTGTALGDPIEIRALSDVMRERAADDGPCALGAVKTVLGHLEAAAGLAGLVKVLLALEHGAIPPNLHFQRLNPNIALDEARFRIPTKLEPWRASQRARIAALSSFGFSGTNAHVVIEEAPPRPAKTEAPGRPAELVTLSAKSESALRERARDLADFSEEHAERVSLADLAHSANTGRSRFAHRLALQASSHEELRTVLSEFAHAGSAEGVVTGVARDDASPAVAFLFTGQGSLYPGMGRQLYESEASFRHSIDRCAELIDGELELPLQELLFADGDASLRSTLNAQVALLSLEYALCELWRSWGLEPCAALGHSAGDYAAACAAGVFELETALRLVCERGRLMDALPSAGGMAAAFADAETVAKWLDEVGDEVAVAAIHGPDQTVISGERAALGRCREVLAQRGIETRALEVSHAFHSPLMEPVLEPFGRFAEGFAYRAPEIPLPGHEHAGLAPGSVPDADHWVRQIREPVRFQQGIQSLWDAGIRIFLELGPSQTLATLGRRCVDAGGEGTWVASLERGREDGRRIVESLATLAVSGAEIDWRGFDRDRTRTRVALPTYRFARQSWGLTPVSTSRIVSPSAPVAIGTGHPLLGPELSLAHEPNTRVWQLELTRERFPELLDHGFHESPVVPAAFFLELAVAALDEGKGAPIVLEDVAFERLLFLSDADAQQLQVSVRSGAGSETQVEIHGRSSAGEGAIWTRHLRAQTSSVPGVPSESQGDSAARSRCAEELPPAMIYEAFAAHGLQYGPAFRRLEQVWRGDREAVGRIGVSPASADDDARHGPHATQLDAGFQLLAAALSPGDGASGLERTYVPAGIDRLSVVPGRVQELEAHARLLGDAGEDALLARLRLRDAAGALRVAVDGLRLRAIPRGPNEGESVPRSLYYERVWSRAELSAGAASARETGPWLILCDEGGRGEALARALRDQGQACRLVYRANGSVDRAAELRHDDGGDREVERRSIDGGDREALGRWLRDAVGDDLRCRGVVHCFGLDAGDDSGSGADELEASQCQGTLSALALTQALAEVQWRQVPRLWLVTRGAQVVPGDQSFHALSQAPLWGLGATIALEHTELRCSLVDLDPAERERESEPLVAELLAGSPEDRVAFRNGQRLVSRIAAASPVAAGERSPSPPVRADGTYLVTGGLGDLGRAVAGWLVEEGARHLVLVSRGTATHDVEDELARRGEDVRVHVAYGDVACEADVERILSKIERELPPLRGVFHCAGVLDDGIVLQLDASRFHGVLRPKMQGAWNLHRRTAGTDLDHFVLFSSAASLLGAPGQGNYAAANAFLDALALRRQADGLPATAISWGPWAEIGMAARGAGSTQLARLGIRPLAPKTALLALSEVLAGSSAQIAVLDADWKRIAALRGASPLLEGLAQGPAPPDRTPGLVAELAGREPAQQRPLLRAHFREQVGRTLGIEPAQVDPALPLSDQGVDSIMAIELANGLEADLGLFVPSTLVFNHPTVDEVSAELARRLGLDAPDDPRPEEAESLAELLDVVEALSDSEARELAGAVGAGE